MKKKLSIPKSRPLAYFLPTIVINAKDLATKITVFIMKDKGLSSERSISSEHNKNNQGVRKLL